MRVIHVAPTQFGREGLFGGGERYPLELARALARRVDTELITFGREERVEIEPAGLRVRVLPARHFLHGHPAHPLAPRLPGALIGADLIHTHHLRSTPSGVAAVVAETRGIPLVTTDHGLAGSDWGGALKAMVDRFLLVSRFSARVLGAPPEKTSVIYGGADTERFRPDHVERREGVLFVGRLTPHKGVDRLIEALPPGSTLRLAGSTGHDANLPERDYPALLRRLAAGKRVQFVGPLPDSELPELYRRASVFALPSVETTVYGKRVAVSELLGLSVLEAMASGTPVVASRLGGLTEIVEHGVTGFLVQPGSVSELREAIEALESDAALARRMGKAARERVLERFTWEVCAERCMGAYSGLL